MGSLYDTKVRIDSAIKSRNLDAVAVNGEIVLRAGFLLAFINPSTPDDPAKLQKLRTAAQQVLGVSV